MNILILYTKNIEEVFNRKSAIGSYIHCLSNLLSTENNTVFLNGERIDYLKKKNKDSILSESIKISFIERIKKVTPKFIKRYLRDKKLIKSNHAFKKDLLARNQDYDVVLEFYTIGSEVGKTIAQHQNIPLYVTYDGPIFEEYRFFNNNKRSFFESKFKQLEKQTLEKASKIIVYSDSMKNYLAKFIKNPQKIHIHQNIDFSRFDVLNTKKEINTLDCLNICFIGSFLKWHQVDFLIDGFVELVNLNLDVKLFLIGDGMEKQHISNLVNNLPDKIKRKIILTGYLDGEKLLNLKSIMDIGVMPGSNWYGAPNKIFEYGAMNMAVLTPNTPTIKDIFNEKNVCFFEWKNKKDFISVMIELASDRILLKKYADQLYDDVTTNYSTSITKEFYLSLFK
jgi:glycosyltransferase involved in cell wall biosynthesis